MLLYCRKQAGDPSNDEGSNWSLLARFWAVEDRPDFLQCPNTVNKLPLDNLMVFHKSYLESAGASGLKQVKKGDPDPPVLVYKEKKDDGLLSLHKARFERSPIKNPEEWYHMVPIKRSPIIKKMPLEHTGSQFAVSDQCVESLHDRSRAVDLHKFYVGNFNVRSKPQRETTTYSVEGQVKQVELAWEECGTIDHIKEALVNYLAINQQLWPLDTTGVSMLRLMFKYRWVSFCADSKVRREIICSWFHMVSLQNASNALNDKPPISFECQEKTLREVVEKRNIKFEVPTNSYTIPKKEYEKSAQGGRVGNNTQTGSSGRLGTTQQNLKQVATYRGNMVCYSYNNLKTCAGLLPGGKSCKKGDKTLEHVCNLFANGNFCLKPHPRKKHVN